VRLRSFCGEAYNNNNNNNPCSRTAGRSKRSVPTLRQECVDQKPSHFTFHREEILDNDGRITKEELALLMRSFDPPPTDEQLTAILDMVDTDHNGTIEFEEFLVLMNSQGEGAQSIDDEIMEAFKEFDENGDGHTPSRDRIFDAP
jgi:Ca2+-binding EF-hand superfamily protein